MAPAELNYEIHDKEMLAIVRALDHWRSELQGSSQKIEIYTDHKALEWFMSTKKLNARQARWAETLANFDFEIMYHPGFKNGLADALTRREPDVLAQGAVKEEIRFKPLLKRGNISKDLMENLDDKLQNDIRINFLESTKLIDKILIANRTHASFRDLRSAATKGHKDLRLEDGLLLFKERLMVPETDDHLRTELINEVHSQLSSAHPSDKKTAAMLTERYFWKGLRDNVKDFVRNCHVCGRSKARRDKTPGLLHPLPIADRPWQHICVDFKSQPKDKKGFDNVCVFIDRFSKAPVSIPCHKTATAKEMAEIYYVYVYRYYDLPDSIVSDRGPQFISDFWAALTAILGVKLLLSTAYSPQTDGQTEIMNQYSDQRLRPFVNHYQDNWSDLLPAMDNAQLCLPHSSLGGMTPFMLTRGYTPRKSFDWQAPKKPETAKQQIAFKEATCFARRLFDVWNFAKDAISRAQATMVQAANRHRREPDWKPKDFVYLSTKNLHTDRPSKKLSGPYAGPFEVLSQHYHSYRLKLPASWRIHPIFHARYLRKHPNNPLPGQVNKESETINVTGDDEYVVESLLAVKTARGRGGGLKYRANWLGYDEDPDWYPASNFKYSPLVVRDFHRQYPNLPGPPEQLREWIKAYENGEDNYDHLSSNKAMAGDDRDRFFAQQ